MDEKYLIQKWLADDLTDAEQEAFKKSKDYKLNMKIIEGAKQFKASHFSTVSSYDELKAKLETKSTPIIQLKSYKILYRIAALFVIGFSSFFLFLFANSTTVNTLASQKTNIELPDASNVTLNAASTIHFNKFLWNFKRKVDLEGEAFFKVQKGSKFDVITSGGIVSVIGTQFNVKNRANYFEVKCYEGIVSVETDGKSHRLTKGNTIRVVDNRIVADTTDNIEPKWINNSSSFKSVPLLEVINEVERQYNISINTQKVDTDQIYTGGFVHDNLDQALKAITVPFDLNYSINESKRNVIISSE